LSASLAVISVSIRLVASGSAGAPSGVENLMPLYSGGLWEAVKLMAPSAFLANHGVGDGRGGGRFGDQQRRDAVGGENFFRHGAESFAQEARVAAHDYARPGSFLRNYVARDSSDGAAHVGEGKLVGHDGAPA
jgi:hypothetical protein